MKRIFYLLALFLLISPACVYAQDAALEERFNKLSAQIEDLIAAKDAQNRRIEQIALELREMQERQNKSNPTYASQDDLRRLAEKLQEIDRKRQDDNERILKEIDNLGKTLSRPAPQRPVASGGDSGSSGRSDKGYEYVIQPGDTLSVVIQAYREKNINVTLSQVLKANPGLDPNKLKPGQKVFIPAP